MNEITIKGAPLPKDIVPLIEQGCAALAADYSHAKTIVADATRAFKRVIARAETLSEEWTREEVKPTRGPTIEFWGREIASTEFINHRDDPLRITLEVWETRAGALVAIASTAPEEREGFEVVKALVVQPQEDVQAMRLEVMGFFDWHDRARNMARKAGWNLRIEVE